MGNIFIYFFFLTLLCLGQVILDNVQCALSLWSGINIEGCPSTSNNYECPLADTLPILYTIVDLLSLKVIY